MINKLLVILLIVIRRLDQWMERRDRKRHEQKVKDARANPDQWFNDHFGGVQSNPSGKPDDVSDAPVADEAGDSSVPNGKHGSDER